MALPMSPTQRRACVRVSGNKNVSASIHAKANKAAEKKQAMAACAVNPNLNKHNVNNKEVMSSMRG